MLDPEQIIIVIVFGIIFAVGFMLYGITLIRMAGDKNDEQDCRATVDRSSGLSEEREE